MSADFPLEEPQRRLSEGDGARDSDVHNRNWRYWDGYYAVVWLSTVAFALGGTTPSPTARVTAALLLTTLVPWYLRVGRHALLTEGEDERAALRFIVVEIVVFVPAATFVPEIRLAAFALIPQCFMLLRIRHALTAVAVVNTVPVVTWAAVRRPSSEWVFFNSLSAVVALAFSMVFGTWVIRVIEQSRERAALIEELDASREEVARLSADRGALAERERLTREIHDTLAQGFTSVLMLVQAVEAELADDVPQARRHLALMGETARQNLAEARALVAGGAPADLDGASLPDAVRRLAERHSAAVEVSGTVRLLPAGLEVVALRSCQEALANVRKHAGNPATVTVGLDYADSALTVVVRDDGQGFSPAGLRSKGYGLPGLRARAAEVGGTAEIHSATGVGTTVTVSLPLPTDASRRPE